MIIKKLSKKGIELQLNLIITLIVLLMVLSVMVYFTFIFTGEIDRSSNVQAVKSWALKESLIVEKSKEFFASNSLPPVSPLSDPIQIKSRNQIVDPTDSNYASKLIADAMIDCWSAFGKGKLDFLKADTSFCYPCVGIKISDEIKKEANANPNFKIPNFYGFLTNTHPLGDKNSQSYWEMLGGSTSEEVPTDFKYDIDLKQDQYIFFAARKGGIGWPKVFAGAGVGAVAGGVIAIVATGGLAIPVIAAAGAGLATFGVGAKLKSDAEKDFSPAILIGPPEKINAYCNVKSESDLNQTKTVV